MVPVGIVLFVLGFLLVLYALPHSDQSTSKSSDETLAGHVQSTSSSREVFLLTGMFVSFAGVVIATVGPAVGFMRRLPKD